MHVILSFLFSWGGCQSFKCYCRILFLMSTTFTSPSLAPNPTPAPAFVSSKSLFLTLIFFIVSVALALVPTTILICFIRRNRLRLAEVREQVSLHLKDLKTWIQPCMLKHLLCDFLGIPFCTGFWCLGSSKREPLVIFYSIPICWLLVFPRFPCMKFLLLSIYHTANFL